MSVIASELLKNKMYSSALKFTWLNNDERKPIICLNISNGIFDLSFDILFLTL